ncbi:MAG: alpha/beta hydrolase [Candidatus Lokiarchaeota archaeon]|nr:alpha/beta hydrolase [Candidatus Lokiarchaeota archaeon]
MKLVEAGTFSGKYAYIRLKCNSNSKKTLVVFPPSQELMYPLKLNMEIQIKRYKSLIPSDILGNVYIIGYDPNITVDTYLAEIAEDFSKFIREKIGPCAIAGISYGGGISIPFAAKYPELTERLILVVSSYALSENGVDLCNTIIQHAKNNDMFQVQLILNSLFHNPLLRAYFKISTRLKWSRMQSFRNPPSTIVNAYTHLLNHNYELKQYISRIQAPTLIIGGTKDQFLSKELYEEIDNAISDSCMMLFKNATHTVPIEKLFKVRKLIHDFLKT